MHTNGVPITCGNGTPISPNAEMKYDSPLTHVNNFFIDSGNAAFFIVN